MTYSTVKALRGFSYSDDGIGLVKVATGDAIMVRDDLIAGLISEGYAQLPGADGSVGAFGAASGTAARRTATISAARAVPGTTPTPITSRR